MQELSDCSADQVSHIPAIFGTTPTEGHAKRRKVKNKGSEGRAGSPAPQLCFLSENSSRTENRLRRDIYRPRRAVRDRLHDRLPGANK